jgi:drug/metabolite transporter (DMT)-like permease
MKYVFLSAYMLGIVAGQLLFKVAANRLAGAASWSDKVMLLLVTPHFYAASALYALLTVLWIWILTIVPLSRAYPFIAVSIVLTQLAGAVFFAEPLSARFLLGSGLILVGLLLTQDL